jgi:predicted dehydrogenase
VKFATDVQASLVDPRVQAIVLATPIETHGELALSALEHGKDVLVEKPVATDLLSFERLVARARERKRLLAVNHLLLHHPAVRRMRDEIQRGTIGRVRGIVSLRVSQGTRELECPWWTLAPHDLALIDNLVGLPSAVSLEQHGTETRARLVAAEFEGRLLLSLCGERKVRLFAVQGTEGTLLFDDLQPHPLTLHRREATRLPLDERLLRGRLGFGEPMPLPRTPPLETALEVFVALVRAGLMSSTNDEAHMRRVVASLERGRAFVPPQKLLALEVPA